jgi:hypothetical protein
MPDQARVPVSDDRRRSVVGKIGDRISSYFKDFGEQAAISAARQSGWKWSVNLDEKRPAGL